MDRVFRRAGDGLPVALWGAIQPDDLAGAVLGFTDFVIQGASWWWLILCTGFVVLAAVMALGPYGGVRLGADDERPELSTPRWIAMLFAGGSRSCVGHPLSATGGTGEETTRQRTARPANAG
jgi:hypothetical protein